MKLLPTSLDGVLLVEPVVHRDDRGQFFEIFHAARFAEQGVEVAFVQDNQSGSRRHVLRGLHLQSSPHLQGKLVRALSGEIFDVAVDVRRGSPSFGRWHGEILTAESGRSLWVPEGFAHGFCVLSDWADVEYKCTTLYRPEAELSIRWDDPEIGVDWPVETPLLSPKDRAAPSLAEVLDRLPASAG